MYKLNIACEHAPGLYTTPLVLAELNIFERKGEDETLMRVVMLSYEVYHLPGGCLRSIVPSSYK